MKTIRKIREILENCKRVDAHRLTDMEKALHYYALFGL